MAPKKDEPMDPRMALAEALRSKGGIENRAAVAGGERFELFRAKDFVRWVKAHPDKCAAAAAAAPTSKDLEGEDLARWLGQQLIRRGLVRRVDRVNKKPLPGSKRLVKFPRKIGPLPPDQATAFADDGFFVWTYERPASPYAWLWTALIPLAVVGCCLFPLAPDWAKVVVFYASAGLLSLMLGVLALRGALALGSWVLTGRTVWLLPNLMSEEVPITQLHKPFISVDTAAEGSSKWARHPATRLAVGAAAGAVLLVLYSHAPNKASITTEASRYKDDVMEWLGVRRDGYARLSNGTAAGNATAAGDDAAAEATGAAEAGAEADAAAEEEAKAEAEEAAEEDAEEAGGAEL